MISVAVNVSPLPTVFTCTWSPTCRSFAAIVVLPLRITVSPVNDAPIAQDDAYSTAEDTALTVGAPGVLGNDSDADGNPLTAILLTQPTHGTVTLSPNGQFVYVPATNFSGSDSFTYKANDGSLDSGSATVRITGEE